LRRVLAALLMLNSLALLVPTGAGQQTLTAMGAKQLEQRLQTAFAGFATKDTPGFAALVKRNRIVLFAEGFGVRDLREKARIDARTNFRLASCTKQFTAMAIMLLVHDGKLRYEETLPRFFRNFPLTESLSPCGTC